jgi:hypothetical protein
MPNPCAIALLLSGLEVELVDVAVLGPDAPHRARDGPIDDRVRLDVAFLEADAVEQYFRSGSETPILAARSRFSGVSRIRRPCICPPMQRSAPAAITPSGAAPMPM